MPVRKRRRFIVGIPLSPAWPAGRGEDDSVEAAIHAVTDRVRRDLGAKERSGATPCAPARLFAPPACVSARSAGGEIAKHLLRLAEQRRRLVRSITPSDQLEVRREPVHALALLHQG